MGCCCPGSSGGPGYEPINDIEPSEAHAAAASSLRAGRWSPISYGKKTWGVGADGTLQRPAAYVHPVLWATMAGAEGDEKEWKRKHRHSKVGSSERTDEPPLAVGGGDRAGGTDEEDAGWGDDAAGLAAHQRQGVQSSALATVGDALPADGDDGEDDDDDDEGAPLLAGLPPTQRGAEAIARAAERQRAAATAAGGAPPAAGSAAAVAPLLGGVSDEQRAAEEVMAKKAARKRAKKDKKRTAAAASPQAPKSPLFIGIDELCIKNHGLYVKNDELCIKKDELCIL